ncbi:MAG: hypothetical protein EP323_00310 [Gammaproteobacteria bacterium]|nr:MAG: hypothetical protein EP323_00310 [Gammaproteobacteria bacterium]
MNTAILKQAIKEAGGIKVVADANGKSYEAVRKWTVNGLPRTEWTGETQYAHVIASLQSVYTAADLLQSRAA